MSDADQDRDVLIQRYSADLVADLDRSLGPFLRRQNGELRKRVRVRDHLTDSGAKVLEPFQELPQLLDPHLSSYLPALAEAYLENLQHRGRNKPIATRSQLLEPLSKAICNILYAFCKIRGEKVIVRFLNVETRYLELLLLAIEEAEREFGPDAAQATTWSWHERYIVLLWLSQLFFAPFDLSTISSGDLDDTDRPVIPGFQWPPQTPGIALRVIPLGIKSLGSPGKERDGAKALLVRVAMRKDMQAIGILHSLVQWAIHTIGPTGDAPAESPYFYIGSLSFLAGVLAASADTSTMDQYLTAIFHATRNISLGENTKFAIVHGSALARKMMIKVIRSVITLILRKPRQSMDEAEMVEASIGYLLENLSDNDTPVRLAASKSLSIITLKLEPDMASQVVEAVLESLNRNVLWLKPPMNQSGPRLRDVTAVDPLEWHGLMLTLSHLLYRRSPPPDNLSDIIHALLMGLAFEQRGPSGASTGTNVRDAACFGIWALARRYTTAELLRVPTRSLSVTEDHVAPKSILQVIATDLVVAGSLDPAGNIRRGSSAALQELIGRHPDTVVEGIALVQTVDYHAVALRSRAIHEVSSQATRLSAQYGLALLDALLGWRGIGDMDAAARRVAAASFGTLTAEVARMPSSTPFSRIGSSMTLLLGRYRSLKVRQVEERHGVLLSLASVLDSLAALLKDPAQTEDTLSRSVSQLLGLMDGLGEILHDCSTITFRKPELIAEAVGQLMVASYPVLLTSLFTSGQELQAVTNHLLPGRDIVVETNASFLPSLLFNIDGREDCRPARLVKTLTILEEAINHWLNRSEPEVTEVAAQASMILVLFSRPDDRSRIVSSWVEKIQISRSSRNKHGNGYFHALARIHHIAGLLPNMSPESKDSGKALVWRWNHDDDIETRVAILQSLTDRDLLREGMADFMSILSDGLDDYTSNARGDVGSHVRLEAIRATKTIFKTLTNSDYRVDIGKGVVLALYPRILRLAAEKLDRVRVEAQAALALLIRAEYVESFSNQPPSSRDYFAHLFKFCKVECLLERIVAEDRGITQAECMSSLLAGLVTSADTGNEDLVIASRSAVADFCSESADNVSQILTALINNLKLHQGQDRVVVPTLELLAYLFHIGVLQCYKDVNLRQICLLTQKAGYKTGNVRKIEACIKVYGGVASVEAHEAANQPDLVLKRKEGISEAKRRLGALLIHPWPRVRTLVIDELFGLLPEETEAAQKLMGVDWGKAEKTFIKRTVTELELD